MLYCFHAGQVSKKRIAKEEKEKKKRLNNYLSTLFHSRVRGGLRLNRTLGLRGDSNHSAQRLAEPRRVTDIFLLENSATPTRRRRASVSETLRALALQRHRLLPL